MFFNLPIFASIRLIVFLCFDIWKKKLARNAKLQDPQKICCYTQFPQNPFRGQAMGYTHPKMDQNAKLSHMSPLLAATMHKCIVPAFLKWCPCCCLGVTLKILPPRPWVLCPPPKIWQISAKNIVSWGQNFSKTIQGLPRHSPMDTILTKCIKFAGKQVFLK